MGQLELGVDTGGTFIDVVCRDCDTDEVLTVKGFASRTKPADAMIDALRSLAEMRGTAVEELLTATRLIVHGTTVGTNVLVTSEFPRTALLTTAGFRDVLAMRRGVREEPMNSNAHQPHALVPRALRIGVRERIASDGSVRRPLAQAEVDRVIDVLAAADVRAVAVCLMFGFLNPVHERRLADAVREAFPATTVSVASDLLPQVRFFERTSTAVVDAVIAPLVSEYIGAIAAALNRNGFRGKLLLVQSDGGVCTAEAARRAPARLVMSGPASGATASAQLCRRYGLDEAISADMGGTSFDVCLISSGDPEVATGRQVAGCEVALPMTAIHTIGAGGGSVVTIDSRGLLQIGPESAGADPGPMCYGRGGERPTITDANLVLGFLDSDRFWGGRMQLDAELARSGIADAIARPSGESPERAAWAVYRVANESMADAMREVSMRRGHDIRRCAIIAVGGAAALHMASVAEELEVPLVIVPGLGPVFCAAGGLDGDLRFEAAHTVHSAFERDRAASLERELEDAALRARTAVTEQAGEDIATCELELSIDVRYAGQFREVRVPLPDERLAGRRFDAALAEFYRRHEAINGYSDPTNPVETVTVRAVAIGRRIRTDHTARRPQVPQWVSVVAQRTIYWDGQPVEAAVHDLSALVAGDSVSGPATIVAPYTTVLVPPSWQGMIDGAATVLLTRAGCEPATVLRQLGSEFSLAGHRRRPAYASSGLEQSVAR